jgi:hypothetical protein
MTIADKSSPAWKALQHLREIEAQLVLAQVRILRLECALEFYAAITNWDNVPKDRMSPFCDVIQMDGRQRGWDVAKTALHGKPEAA